MTRTFDMLTCFVLPLIMTACIPGELIMENRTNCPCYVHVDFSGLSPEIRQADLWFLNSDGNYDFHRRFEAPFPDGLYIPVKKGDTHAYLWGNIHTSVTDDINLTVTFKDKVELLWSWSQKLDTRTENAEVRPVAIRRGCPIEIAVSARISDYGTMSVTVISASNGYTYSGTPISKEFRERLILSDGEPNADDRVYHSILPYQTFSDKFGLELDFIYDGLPHHLFYDLGEYLSAQEINLENAERVRVHIEVTDIGTGGITIIPVVNIYEYDIEM